MALHLEFQDNVAVLRHDDGKRNVFSHRIVFATSTRRSMK